MTQDELDAHWLQHVDRPNERQLTPRAVITGMLIGGVMSLSNLYVGLKTGWGLAVTVTAAVLAFGIFSGIRRVAPVGPFKQDFTALENPLTLGIQTDPLMVGAGAIMGVRIGVSLFIGAVVGWGVLGAWMHTHGLAGAAPTFATVRTWLVWPGVTLVVINGLLVFGLKWRTALTALSSLGKLARGQQGNGGMAAVEVPASWFLRGTVASTLLTVVLARLFFDIPIWMGLLAVVLSALLSIVACRATGETSITPLGPLGKITQLMYGGIAAGDVQTNLMGASITAGAAMHSADLLTDLKGGICSAASRATSSSRSSAASWQAPCSASPPMRCWRRRSGWGASISPRPRRRPGRRSPSCSPRAWTARCAARRTSRRRRSPASRSISSRWAPARAIA